MGKDRAALAGDECTQIPGAARCAIVRRSTLVQMLFAIGALSVAGCMLQNGDWLEIVSAASQSESPFGDSPFAELSGIELPRDESPHVLEGVEWWYFTGLLSSADGREFGVLAVVFRSPLYPQNAHIGHYAVTDVSGGTFQYDQNLWLFPQAESPASGFRLTTGVVRMEGDGEDVELSAAMSDGSWPLELSLKDERGPVLHGGDGIVPYGPFGQQAYYYSRPRMRASGTLDVDGETTAVKGTMWFDRQWGAAIGNPLVKWDWFSIRLDDGTDIMLFHFPKEDDCLRESEAVVFGTYWPADGESETLDSSKFSIQTTAHWLSPRTGALYGAGWEVGFDAQNTRLVIEPVLAEQELDARNTTLNVYWEGLCHVTGVRDGQAVTGHAFVELANGGSAEAAR